MDSFLLTDGWTTIGGTGASSITQPSTQWLDLPDYEDLVFFLEVKEVTGTVTLAYESGPTCEDWLFVQTIPSFTIAAGSRTDTALFATGGFPLSRYLRWKLTGGATWSCTFRVHVAAYSFGRDDE